MNKEKQYFQYLVGQERGNVVYKTGEEEIMDEIFYIFNDGNKMRENLIGVIDDKEAASGGMMMCELSHPSNKWTFTKEQNPLYKTPEYVTTEDGKRYEIPNVDGSLPSEVERMIEVATPPLSSKMFERRLRNSPHADSTSSVIRTNEIEESQLYNKVTVPKGELIFATEMEEKIDEKLEKLFNDFIIKNSEYITNVSNENDTIPNHIKILADNIKRTEVVISVDLKMQLPSISTINILRSDTFNSEAEYIQFIDYIVNNINKEEVLNIIKKSIVSVYNVKELGQ